MLGLFALALAAADPGPTPPKSIGVGSLAGLFSADDYPRDAADRNEQGRVQVTVHIDAAGAVSSCEIKQSSGFPSLDTRTCEIIARRAKFIPARDSAGNAVPSETTQTVTWRLSTGPEFTPSDPWGVSAILTYGPDKQPQSCRMEPTGFAKSTAPSICPPGAAEAMAQSALPGLPDGTTSVVSSTDFRLGPAASLTLGPGDVLMQRSVAEISVDESGHQTACKMTVSDAARIPADNLCAPFGGAPYRVRTGPDGKPAPFTATIATVMIAHVGSTAAH